MAKKTITSIIDDFDGAEGASTVRFGFEGSDYEIDLGADHRQALADLLLPYISAGRSIQRRATATTTGLRGASGSNDPAIRIWAKSNGIEVPSRGRLSEGLRSRYAKEHVQV